MKITALQLLQVCPWLNQTAASWADSLNDAMEGCEATTAARAAMFLGQGAHESGGFRLLEENLLYSAEQLLRTWPSRFVASDEFVPLGHRVAAEYAHQPEKIANFVYGSRGGNGDEASGDGWRFRGRGFGITFRGNYAACSLVLLNDASALIDEPEQLANPYFAAVSFAWYWKLHGLNDYADAGDLDGCSDVINIGRKTAAQGDAIGYADRKIYCDKFGVVLNQH